MKNLYISQTIFSTDEIQLNKLNDLLLIQDSLSLDLIVGGTGCPKVDALAILILLWENNLADGTIYAHLKEPPHKRVSIRSFEDGPPRLPIIIESDDDEGDEILIDDMSKLFFRFEFDLHEKVQFSVTPRPQINHDQ